MDSKDFSSYKKLYIKAATSNLQVLKDNLLILTQHINHQTASENMHRAVHNLKTESLLMKHRQLAIVCKTLEDIFARIKNGQSQMSPSLLKLIESATQYIEESLSSIRKEEKEKNDSRIIYELQKHIENI